MKRNHHGAPVDPLHPHLCFHREVLIYQEWAVIRQNFLEALQRLSSSGPNRFSWNEPRKLWRHSQEALGKWILSQVARLKSKDLDLRRDLFFFPTEDMMSRGGRCISPKETGSSSLSYDAQLLRDLAMKSSAAQHSEHVELLRETLENFNLLKQCTRADKRIRQEMELVTPFNAISPIVRELDHNDASCSPVQKRIKGTIIEITAKYQVKEGIKIKFPVVSIPKAAMEKLQRSYSRFGKEVDEKEYGNSNSKDEGKSSSESFFLHRAATVALRYEGSLATGSLQLCADTSFKQHLHAKGYHVMDLCASPINAYCGVPHESTFSRSSSSLASSEGEPIITESPNYFCSAFVDCDAYFGSLGSALRVSPEEIHALVNTSPACDQDPTPLLLTYDVPYDEDLVEHLFLKLEKDLLRARENKSANLIIDYVLVLPLWWATPFAVDKTIFMSTDGATSTTVVPVGLSGELQLSEVREGDRSVAEAAAKLIASRSAAEHQGYRIPYQWPQRLAATVGRGPQKLFPVTSTDQDGFLCWDAIFFDDSYRYFCTATHQWLRGVTATEVIALHTPLEQSSQGKSLLEQAISSFYGPSAMPPASKD